MCGIAGILLSDGASVCADDLARLGKALAHRGPDGEGIWASPDHKAAFVHRRLAIIDTSVRGHQPMESRDGQYTIVFNGEIYNFLELRQELEELGAVFRSESDTEVILEAWRQWGEGMLHRFNGMWALAIRDNSSGNVFLARDRFGIKPLLYAKAGRQIAFASEVRALLTLSWIDRQGDAETATRLLFDPFSIEGGERSLFRGIWRLQAGHVAYIRDGHVTTKRWWHTTDHLIKPPPTIQEQAEQFREIFLNAVKLRMRSDVAIGTCLSGGFDSVAIAGSMAHVAASHHPRLREAAEWRHAFIASFPGQDNDETPLALEAARYAGVRPHVLPLHDEDALAQIDSVLEDLDDVYISLPTAPWQIYRALRFAGTLVSLDGHGADELMGAYRQEGEPFGFVLRNMLASGASRSWRFGRLIEAAKLAWLNARGLSFLRHHQTVPPARCGIPFERDQLPEMWGGMNRRLYQMFHVDVLPTILRNFDRLSMAHGVEVRMPFMDWRLVTFVMSLPDESKSSHGVTKYVARQALNGLMPDSIRLARLKVGFNSPMPAWLNGPLQHWTSSVLHRPNAMFDEMVDRPALLKKIEELNQSRSWTWSNTGRLWPYINMKWYLDRHGGR